MSRLANVNAETQTFARGTLSAIELRRIQGFPVSQFAQCGERVESGRQRH